MKLYLSSYRIPTPGALAELIDKPLPAASVALITNAKDYYSERARRFKVSQMVNFMEQLGLAVTPVDLREYDNPNSLKQDLSKHDLVWAMGGNTYVLRYEMQRSGFDDMVKELLAEGIVFGGDSAGALVAGVSIAGVELGDEPEFAEVVINEGLGLVPYVVLPHVNNPEFAAVVPVFRSVHQDKDIIELNDSQAVIFNGQEHFVVEEESSVDEAYS